MIVTVWGCRGSIPAPGPEKVKYGGNTSCVQITYKDTCLILDGGSGIARLGSHQQKEYKNQHILLSHLHIDHTMGLGFFGPIYNPTIDVHLWGPSNNVESLEHRLRRYFSPPLFPIRLAELPTHPIIHEIMPGQFMVGELSVTAHFVCHPGPTMGYRITDGKSVVTYIPDHELSIGAANFPHEAAWTSGYDLAIGADLLFHDAQFTDAEYVKKLGWGHSTYEGAIAFATLCKVKRLSLFHHDPSRTDAQLDELLHHYTHRKHYAFGIDMCAEGKVYDFS